MAIANLEDAGIDNVEVLQMDATRELPARTLSSAIPQATNSVAP